jgi:hypothetical protein
MPEKMKLLFAAKPYSGKKNFNIRNHVCFFVHALLSWFLVFVRTCSASVHVKARERCTGHSARVSTQCPKEIYFALYTQGSIVHTTFRLHGKNCWSADTLGRSKTWYISFSTDDGDPNLQSNISIVQILNRNISVATGTMENLSRNVFSIQANWKQFFHMFILYMSLGNHRQSNIPYNRFLSSLNFLPVFVWSRLTSYTNYRHPYSFV